MLRLDDNEDWALAAKKFPEIAHDAGCEAAYTALQKDVGEIFTIVARFNDFGGDGAVPLHHITWNCFIALVRGIGNNDPVVVSSNRSSVFN
ncbi:hypothetical protein D3C81_1662690 [compost metagenome]